MVNASGPEKSGVLLLPRPSGPESPVSWYHRTITGVPFLLLNILNIQKGGLERLTIYGPWVDENGSRLLQSLAQDRRIRIQLEWAASPQQARQALDQPGCRMVLDGQWIHHWSEVRAALQGQGPLKPASALGPWIDNGLQGPPPEPDEAPHDSDQPLYLEGLPGRKLEQVRDFKQQTSRLLKSSGLGNDSLMDRWVTRHISRLMTRVFVEFPITPNQITLVSLVVGLAGALCFLQGGYEWGVAGAVLVQISAWIDCTDGEVARLKFQESPLGSQLDIWSDNLVHITVFFSIGLGLYFSTEQGIYKTLGSLAAFGAMGSFALLQGAVVDRKNLAAAGHSDITNDSLADRLANRDFTYFLLVTACVNYLEVFLVLTAVGSNVFAASLAYSRFCAPRKGT